MQVPETINVLTPDYDFGFFTAMINGNTLGRTTLYLKDWDWSNAKLINYRSDSFYQNNNDVTIAYYKVKGYKYPCIIWFYNKTGKRIN